MASSELIILDVGHGNCAIVKHGSEAVVVDAPGKPVVARALDELGITAITALLLSHADKDHLSGAIPLILNQERPVHHVYVNRDGRSSDTWTRFRQAVAIAEKEARGRPKVHPSVSTADSGSISIAGTTLHVLHPQQEMCLTGTGAVDVDGKRVTANNMSAVVLVEHEGQRVCLLAADSDRRSLDRMIEHNADLRAQVLVFPHHGGRAGSDNRAFAKELVTAVAPDLVLFSLGRGSHGTPRPDVMAGVREALAGRATHIACTQLSTRCASALPPAGRRVLDRNSEGFEKNKCCAGTVSMTLGADGLQQMLRALAENHGTFVAKEVPGALCRKALT